MFYGRKIANRILIVTLSSLAIMFLAGSIVAYYSGAQLNIYRYIQSQLIVMLIAVVSTGIFTRRLAVRLARLLRSSERIKHGNLGARLPEDQEDDEFSELGRALNQMADALSNREITLRQQNNDLSELNRRMESVLNATNDGIALLDGKGVITLVNKRFCELVGVRAEYLLNRTITDAFPPDKLEQFSDLIPRLKNPDLIAGSNPTGLTEEIIEINKNEGHFIQVYTAPVAADEGSDLIGRVVALRDITREYELDRMKNDFISVVSHELRTPLTSIRAFTDLIITGETGEINELQKEFLGIIQTSTNRLTNLINDILDISRIESGRLNVRYDPIDYREMVVDISRMMMTAAKDKNIAIDLSLPDSLPTIKGDADKINQILTNLISNAIKYTPNDGWIKISIDYTDSSVTTCVSDNGIGIDPEDQTKLFQKFFRADNTSTREVGGTGLGLVITKTLIELMGGAIWVDSKPGQGSKFFFTLPLYRDTANLPESFNLPDRGIGLVLVADDNIQIRDTVQHHIHRRGYGVINAADIGDTLQKAKQHRPNAIVINMMMCNVSGFDLLKAIKLEKATESLMVILVSVISEPARGILTLGIINLINKPYEDDRLYNLLSQHYNGEGSPERKTVLFICNHDFNDNADASLNLNELTQKLSLQNIRLVHNTDYTEALTLAITESPEVILVDCNIQKEILRSLFATLKAEEEAASIPIILLSEEINDTQIYLHKDLRIRDQHSALDYITDQITNIVGYEVRTNAL